MSKTGLPMFEIYSTGMALGYAKTAKGKQYPRTERIDKTIKNADISTVVHDGQLFMNENQLYDFMFEATKVLVIKDLRSSNERLKAENARLQEFYDMLLSTEGLLEMNIVAKELKIGVKRLYSFLRANGVMFYKGTINIPYQRFMEQKLFDVVETPCRDGKYRPATYATKKGVEYIRKLLCKNGYYGTVAV